MGENFPEGTSQSDPSAVPPLDREGLEDGPPRTRDEDQAPGESQDPAATDEPSVDEEPENQQTG